MNNVIDINIKFLPQELEAISIIKNVISEYAPFVRAFIVGGLIRDRLLNLPAYDMDVMVSPIKAEDFAKLITKYLNIKDPHIIKENPDKSKFISTSKIYLPTNYGIQEIDIAQARSDIYRENSRIPKTKSATPEEDAYRRDITINTIMYDINNNKIVDFTGMGIKDLITGTIRTPEDPLKTFKDDPLRIFRTIRFAAKYNGTIDPATYEAMKDPSLIHDLNTKVSKERMGQELTKILQSPNADYAIKILKDTGLFQNIISEAVRGTEYENKLSNLDMSQENPNHKLNLWNHTLQTINNTLVQYKEAEPERKIVLTLAALMHDLGKLYSKIWGESKSHPGSRSYHGHEDESSKLIELILRYLKMEPYMQEVSKLAKYHMLPHNLLRDKGGMRSLRRFIRKMGEESLNWLDVFNLAAADAYSKSDVVDNNTIAEYNGLKNNLQEALSTTNILPTQPKIKPILDGNEIMSILNIKQGPLIKEIKEYILELMDENPNITKEEATTLIKQKYNTGKNIQNIE